MPNQEHLAILKQGVEAWNQWRIDNPNIKPDLSKANLIGADLNDANFRKTNLEGAILIDTDLTNAKLRYAKLQKAELQLADLTDANLEKANLENASLQRATLKRTNLTSAILKRARFQETKFQGAILSVADLSETNIIGAECDNNMKCRGINVSGCYGSQRFLRHVNDLDYIEEFKEAHPWRYHFWKITSDCGRSWIRWTILSIAIAVTFGSIFAQYPTWSWLPDWIKNILLAMGPCMEYNKEMTINAFTPYYFSMVTFTTLGFGDITPLNLAGQIWLTIEVILGYIMLGGLITLFATKMVRQSG